MSKYKLGDVVNLQMIVNDVRESGIIWLTTEPDNDMDGLWLDEEEIDKCAAKTYEDGFADAWELARKMVLLGADDGFSISEFEHIFGSNHGYKSALRSFTPQQALAKIEAYEESKAIKVGDVVEFDAGTIAVVTRFKSDTIYVCFGDGTNMHFEKGKYAFKKTGRHIDISNLLEQIRVGGE